MMRFIYFKIKSYYFLFFILFSLIVFLPTIFGKPFWDDWVFLFNKNSDLYSAHSPFDFFPGGVLERAWPVFYFINWILLKVFKDGYVFYHLTSIVLHGVNGYLCWRILRRLQYENSFLVSLIFIAHPLHLFTVGWIIQLKTLFSIFFLLLSIVCILKSIKENRAFYLFCTLIFFTCSIFTKSISAVFLASLAVFWPASYRKYKSDTFINFFIVLFFSLALYSVIKTTLPFFTSDYFIQSIDQLDFFKLSYLDRFALSLKSFLRYVLFIFIPSNPASLFQQSTIINYSALDFFMILSSVSCLMGAIFYCIKNTFKVDLVGFIFFSLSIFPLCGLFFIPMFSTSNFVPHWLSIPFLGLLPLISRHIKIKKYLILITISLLVISHLSSYSFANSEKLYLNSIKQNPDNPLIQRSLVEYYIHNGKCDEALYHNKIYEKNYVLDSYGVKQKISDCFKNARGLK